MTCSIRRYKGVLIWWSDSIQNGSRVSLSLHRMVGADKQKGNLSTVGIVVSDWTYYKRVRQSQTSLRNITFMTWDFGGQEEYYATHQCFISRRSLYLVVWNATNGMAEVEELRPWLLNIQVCVQYINNPFLSCYI